MRVRNKGDGDDDDDKSKMKQIVSFKLLTSNKMASHVTHLAAAHPGAEGELDVLAAPHVHALIEAADGEEVFLIDGERAADEGGGAQCLRLRRDAAPLVGWHLHPHVPETDSRFTLITRSIVDNIIIQ